MSLTKVNKPKRLEETDAGNLDKFDDWKESLLFYLSQELAFIPFLEQSMTWGTIDEANRGFTDKVEKDVVVKSAAQQLMALNRMLGIVVQCAPQHCRTSIKNSTCFGDIWSCVKNYMGLRVTEGQFLKLSLIKREPNERYQHLYHRLRNEHIQCLLSSIKFRGKLL